MCKVIKSVTFFSVSVLMNMRQLMETGSFTHLLFVPAVIMLCACFVFMGTAHAGTSSTIPDSVLVAGFDKQIAMDYPEHCPVEIHGGRIISDGMSGGALKLGKHEYLQVRIDDLIQSAEGSFSVWIRPQWNYYDVSNKELLSHTLLSFGWADERKGYFVLSDGWWEPTGSPYTYFVGNNQDYSNIKTKYPYTAGEWTHFAGTWKAGDSGFLRLYVNGVMIAAQKSMKQSWKPATSLYIGCDMGSNLRKDRWAESDFDELQFFSRALSTGEIEALFNLHGTSFQQRLVQSLGSQLTEECQPVTDQQGNVVEIRAIFDEGTGWMSEAGAKETIQRIKKAGFNVYIPCVWHGHGARYPTALAPTEGNRDLGKIDPLARLITIAHQNGIQVHPWFTIALRQRDFFKEFYGAGTPEEAFDLHRPEFRKFIVGLMVDVVARYDIDGLNLDYIRTMGRCKCDYCQKTYNKKYGRDLVTDVSYIDKEGALLPQVQQWQDEAVEAIVRDISEEGKKIKPTLVVSVDGHPTPVFYSPNSEGRQEIKWANENLIDLIFNMDYSQKPDFDTHDVVRSALYGPQKLLLLLANYDTRSGVIIPRDADFISGLTEYVRKKWCNGVGIYLYSQLSNSQIDNFASIFFQENINPAEGSLNTPSLKLKVNKL
ncbi:MAG: family 10 glycosylhydrolase [Candidatus Riflebacteria bacterium]